MKADPFFLNFADRNPKLIFCTGLCNAPTFSTSRAKENDKNALILFSPVP